MQTLSQTTFTIASLFIAVVICGTAEEHLMVDRTGESIHHYAEAAPPSSTIATNLPIPWSVIWDANAQAMYWTEIGSDSIYRKFLGSGTVEQVYYSSNSVLRGLVIDSATDTLYFLDSNSGTLDALDLDAFTSSTLESGFVRPNDMVMDRVNNTLYLTDSGLDLVGCYDLDSNSYSVVISGSNLVDGVWGIDVVPQAETLYLSDHRTNAIMRANLDGSDLEVLVGGQETPRGLCVDRHHGRLYWLEAESGNLRSSTLDGLDVQVVHTNSAAAPRDLASYEFLDQDGDFMNDDQERFYFGHLLEGAYDDADEDQMDNFTELAFGSNPNDGTDTGMGAQLSFLDGVGPMLGYYMRTDGWLDYSLLHSVDLQLWQPVPAVDELMFIPDGAGGATRIIVMDEAINLFGTEHFFKVEAQR